MLLALQEHAHENQRMLLQSQEHATQTFSKLTHYAFFFPFALKTSSSFLLFPFSVSSVSSVVKISA